MTVGDGGCGAGYAAIGLSGAAPSCVGGASNYNFLDNTNTANAFWINRTSGQDLGIGEGGFAPQLYLFGHGAGANGTGLIEATGSLTWAGTSGELVENAGGMVGIYLGSAAAPINGNYIDFIDSAAAYDVQLINTAASRLDINTTANGGTPLLSANGTMVGIDNAAPSVKLDIYDTPANVTGDVVDLNVAGRINTGNGVTGGVGGMWVGGGKEFIGSKDANTVGFYYNTNWGLTMDNNFNVSILGALAVTGAETVGGLLTASAAENVNGLLTANAGETINGSETITGNLVVDGTIIADGTITSLSASDRRLKQNIAPLTGTLSKLDQLRGVSFEWNHLATSIGYKEGEKNVGMIAQELQKVYPELVKPFKSGHQEYLSIDYPKFSAVLLQSIKELKTQVNTLQDQVKVLQERVNTLEKK